MMLRLPGGVAARIARRELGRHKARSALIVLLVMLPVLAVNLLATGFVSEADDGGRGMFSGGSALVHANLDEQNEPTGGVRWSALDALPQDKFTEISAPVELRIGETAHSATLFVVDFTDPHAAARWARPTSGLPANDQVVVTKTLAMRFDLAPGARIDIDGESFAIAGTVRTDSYNPYGWGGSADIVVGPDHPLAGRAKSAARITYLYGDEPSSQQISELGKAGLSVTTISEQEALQSNDGALMRAFLLGAVAVGTVLTSTIAGAAFAIGVRQQRRSLALLSATGAPSSTLQRTVVGQGVLLGGIGAALGAVLGALAGLALFAWRDSALPGYPIAVRVDPAVMVGSVLVAVLGATIAAWLPARQVANADVLGAVRDAEAAPEPARWPRLGLVLVGLAALVAMAGPVVWPSSGKRPDGTIPVETVIGPGSLCVLLLFFGLLAFVPKVLELLARWSAAGPLALRLALRDGARNRSRASAAVASATAITALFSLLLTANQSMGQTEVDHYRASFMPGVVTTAALTDAGTPQPAGRFETMERVIADTLGPVQGRADLRQALTCSGGAGQPCEPTAQIAPRVVCTGSNDCTVVPPSEIEVTCGQGGYCQQQMIPLVVFSPELFELMTGHAPSAEVVTMVAAGGAVVPTGAVAEGATIVQELASDKTHWVKAVEEPGLGPLEGGVGFGLMAEKSLATLFPKSRIVTQLKVYGTGVAPTQRQVDGLEAALQRAGLGHHAAFVERGPHSGYWDLQVWFGAIGAVLVLGVSLVTIALSLHDARDSLAKLAAVGASSWRLRAMNGIQALVSVGLGVGLGMIVGTLPLAAMIAATRGGVSLDIPWGWLVVLGLGAPLVTALVALVAARPPLPRAVRID